MRQCAVISTNGDKRSGFCSGCERHCRCPFGNDRPTLVPCHLMMVDFVQLHLPERVWTMRVRLPIRFLMSTRNGVTRKIHAKFQFFDADMEMRARGDLSKMFPSMESYELMRDAIIDKYLYSISGRSGKYIIVDERPEFERGVDDFKKLLVAMGKNLREILIKYKREALNQLYYELKQQWEKLGINWQREGELFERDPEMEFKDMMSNEIDKLIKQYEPSIRYPYFELPMSMRRDHDFRIQIQRHPKIGQWLKDHRKTMNWLLGTPDMPEREDFANDGTLCFDDFDLTEGEQ